MPEGQFTGARASYIYATDAGNEYLLTLDTTLATLAGTGLVAATTANAENATPAPKRFKPRIVQWQGTLNNKIVRKRIVCGTVDAELYADTTAAGLTIDGVQGTTTGRRGEKLTYGSLSAPAAP